MESNHCSMLPLSLFKISFAEWLLPLQIVERPYCTNAQSTIRSNAVLKRPMLFFEKPDNSFGSWPHSLYGTQQKKRVKQNECVSVCVM
jgi:hypothetical protein